MSAASTHTNRKSSADALAEAVQLGKIRQVEDLLKEGADPNATGETGMTLLMQAVAQGRFAVVKLLLEHGADVNATRSDGFTPLLLAVFFGRLGILELLLKSGADFSVQGRFGTSAEKWAMSRGFPDIAALLRDARTARPTSSPELSSAEVRPVIEPAEPVVTTNDKPSQDQTAILSDEQDETLLSDFDYRKFGATSVEETLISKTGPVVNKRTFAASEHELLEPFPISFMDQTPSRTLILLARATSSWGRVALLTVAVMLVCGLATYSVMSVAQRQAEAQRATINQDAPQSVNNSTPAANEAPVSSTTHSDRNEPTSKLTDKAVEAEKTGPAGSNQEEQNGGNRGDSSKEVSRVSGAATGSTAAKKTEHEDARSSTNEVNRPASTANKPAETKKSRGTVTTSVPKRAADSPSDSSSLSGPSGLFSFVSRIDSSSLTTSDSTDQAPKNQAQVKSADAGDNRARVTTKAKSNRQNKKARQP